jgi:hypothetical protein
VEPRKIVEQHALLELSQAPTDLPFEIRVLDGAHGTRDKEAGAMILGLAVPSFGASDDPDFCADCGFQLRLSFV